jgi:hypothetical protein
MRTKRRTDITVETDQVVVIRQHKSLARAWCEQCAGQVKILTVGQAAAVASVSQRTIFRRVEAGLLHFTETPDGVLFICLNSLLK